MPGRSGCLVCGVGLQQPANGGRRNYCSRSCRRSAEYELRRLQRQLHDLETFARNLRLLRAPKRQQQAIQGEIDQAQGRLLELLGGHLEPRTPPPRTAAD